MNSSLTYHPHAVKTLPLIMALFLLLIIQWLGMFPCQLKNCQKKKKNTLISSKRNKQRQRSEGYIPWKLSIIEQSAKQLAWIKKCLSPQHIHTAHQQLWESGTTSPISTFPKQSETLVVEYPFSQFWGKRLALHVCINAVFEYLWTKP